MDRTYDFSHPEGRDVQPGNRMEYGMLAHLDRTAAGGPRPPDPGIS